MKTLMILGGGCANCHTLAENAKQAAEALGLEYRILKVTDREEIRGFGVMMTPALVVDGDVKVAGRIPDVEALKLLLA